MPCLFCGPRCPSLIVLIDGWYYLTGYAYETIPNKAIIAGKTHGKDVITLDDASLRHPARGAAAFPGWRREQASGVKQ